MKKIIVLSIVFAFSVWSCTKDTDKFPVNGDSAAYTYILLVKANPRNRVEYLIAYPQAVRLEDEVVITVKAEITNGAPQIDSINFYNPENGYPVSSSDDVYSDNPNIRMQEFVFRASSRGQLKI
ncbi:MAG: hypothetical protein LBJ47_04560 [Tannerella sp.]|jgi:uncharacterized membrane protein (UPF0182 family)|nr:hypothetical protein [Tannerella sp.]